MIRYKEHGITLMVVMATFLFFILTPLQETLGSALQGFIIAFIFFGLLPLGYHFLILKKSRATFALEIGAWRTRVLLLLPVILVALGITIVCYQLFSDFRENFLLPGRIEQSFAWFVGYELLLVPALVLLYEIFFRGFLQKSWLENSFGGWAILVQGVIFILFLLLTASFGWGVFPLVLFSFFSGFLVWYNNSLLQAWIASWLYLLLFDVFLLIMR